MKRLVLVVGVFTVAAAISAVSKPVLAIAPFKAEFEAMYVRKESGDAQHQALAAAAAEAKCNICHKGTSKKEFNPYGAALADLLDRTTDSQDKEKIRSVLTKVAGSKSDASNSSAPTFGQLIEQGKLPGGQP